MEKKKTSYQILKEENIKLKKELSEMQKSKNDLKWVIEGLLVEELSESQINILLDLFKFNPFMLCGMKEKINEFNKNHIKSAEQIISYGMLKEE